MKKLLLALPLAALCFGCSPGAKYHGDWETSSSIATLTASGTTTFSPDGTLAMNLKISSGMGSLDIADKGKWSVEGEGIRVQITEQNWTPSAGNAQVKAMIDQMLAGAKSQAKKAWEDAGVITPTWNGNDSFTITAGQTYNFTRKK